MVTVAWILVNFPRANHGKSLPLAARVHFVYKALFSLMH